MKRFFALAAVCAAVFCAAQFAALRQKAVYPGAGQFFVEPDSAVEDAGLLSLGLRRMGADIAFIRLMQYYGTPEIESNDSSVPLPPVAHEAHADEDHDHDEAAHAGHHHHHHDDYNGPITPQYMRFRAYSMYGLNKYSEPKYDGGSYPEFLERAKHVISLDPYFSFAALYSAGALAFNLGRSAEAVEVLRLAKQYNPSEWKYDSYLAAIGYSKAQDPAKIAEILDRVVRDPECPVLVKQQVAFLNKRLKNYRRAYEIYADIAAASKDGNYVSNAKKQLAALRPLL